MKLFIRILPDDEKKWYPAECDDCGWIGSSELMAGGGAIADTGDFTDPRCPVCMSTNVGETENYQPLNEYVEKITKSSAKVIGSLLNEIDNLRFSQSPKQS